MQYVWLNRQKAIGRAAETDPFCSLSWRLHPELVYQLATDDKEKAAFSRLLDDDAAIYPTNPKERRRFIAELFNNAYNMLKKMAEQVFTNGHTIGEKTDVEFRGALLAAFRREQVPRVGTSTIPPPEKVK